MERGVGLKTSSENERDRQVRRATRKLTGRRLPGQPYELAAGPPRPDSVMFDGFVVDPDHAELFGRLRRYENVTTGLWECVDVALGRTDLQRSPSEIYPLLDDLLRLGLRKLGVERPSVEVLERLLRRMAVSLAVLRTVR